MLLKTSVPVRIRVRNCASTNLSSIIVVEFRSTSRSFICYQHETKNTTMKLFCKFSPSVNTRRVKVHDNNNNRIEEAEKYFLYYVARYLNY